MLFLRICQFFRRIDVHRAGHRQYLELRVRIRAVRRRPDCARACRRDVGVVARRLADRYDVAKADGARLAGRRHNAERLPALRRAVGRLGDEAARAGGAAHVLVRRNVVQLQPIAEKDFVAIVGAARADFAKHKLRRRRELLAVHLDRIVRAHRARLAAQKRRKRRPARRNPIHRFQRERLVSFQRRHDDRVVRAVRACRRRKARA